MQGFKRCDECGETKPLTESGHTSKSNDGYQWKCRAYYEELTRIFDLDAHQEKVLPFLTRTFSLQELVARASVWRGKTRGTSSWMILHYLRAGWPAHFPAFLGRIQRVMQEEYHYPAEGALVLNWTSAMVQGNYWCRRAYEADMIPRMRLFFGTYTGCYEQLPPFEVVEQRQSKQHVLSRHLNALTEENAGEPNPEEAQSSARHV